MKKQELLIIEKALTNKEKVSEALDILNKYKKDTLIPKSVVIEYAEDCFETCKKGQPFMPIEVFLKKEKTKRI